MKVNEETSEHSKDGGSAVLKKSNDGSKSKSRIATSTSEPLLLRAQTRGLQMESPLRQAFRHDSFWSGRGFERLPLSRARAVSFRACKSCGEVSYQGR